MNKEPWLKIWKVNRGYLVNRGCQYLVFRNDEMEHMKEAFGDLLENEDKAGQKWCDRDYKERELNPAIPMDATTGPQTGSY